MKRTLTLEQITIPTPCHADWNAMTGDDRKRFCDQCEKHVFDLSAVSQKEAEAVLNAHGGKLCAQFRRDDRGRIVTTEPPTCRWAGGSAVLTCLLALVGCKKEAPLSQAVPQPGNVEIRRTAGMIAVCTPTSRPADAELRGRVSAPTSQSGEVQQDGVSNEPPTAPKD